MFDKMRKFYNLKEGDQVVINETEGGSVFSRPARVTIVSGLTIQVFDGQEYSMFWRANGTAVGDQKQHPTKTIEVA